MQIRDRSRSRDNRNQINKDEGDQDGAILSNFQTGPNSRQGKKPPIPKEVLEIEEQVFKLRDENSRLTKELQENKDENDKNKSRLKAIELYASDLQRRFDRLENEHNQQKIAFQELTGKDWAKRVILLKNEILQLRTDLSLKDEQLQVLKKRVNTLLSKEDSGKYLQDFFERQTNELLYAKKIIGEYEKRENECTKRWNKNLLNIEKINGLRVQLNRQRETYQSVLAENDRRLADANDRIAGMYNELEKRKAAEFLASQIELLKEERRALLDDNDLLNVKINDLIMENEELRHDNQLVEFLKGTEQLYGNEYEEKLKRMYKRIEELEDMLLEAKHKSGVNRIIDLEAQISSLNLEIAQKSELIESLSQKLQNEKNKEMQYFDEAQAINFFTGLIKEKDEKIKSLVRQMEKRNMLVQEKEHERQKITVERDDVKREVKDLKDKRERFMNIMKDLQQNTLVQEDDRSKWIADEESMNFE